MVIVSPVMGRKALPNIQNAKYQVSALRKCTVENRVVK
jgi:hypothetical protein